MSSLRSVCELAWLQLFPKPGDEDAISKEEFIETGKGQYAWEMWRIAKEEKRSEGGYNIPSNLLTPVSLPVVENKIDISGLDILRSMPNDTWLVNVGGLISKCKYYATNINNAMLLEGDDSMDDDQKPYLVIGKEIVFPEGTHSGEVPIIYANDGMGLDENEIEIDDAIGAIIRTKLIDIYVGKVGAEDTTNNTNSKE